MQIKICNEGDCTSVFVVNPSTGATLHDVHLAIGQGVIVTAKNAHEAEDIEVGEVKIARGGAAVADGEAGEDAPQPDGGSPDSPADDPGEGTAEREIDGEGSGASEDTPESRPAGDFPEDAEGDDGQGGNGEE